MSADTGIPLVHLDGSVVVSLRIDLHDAFAIALRDEVCSAVVARNCKAVLVDVSALPVIDSFLAGMLDELAAACRLLGATTVITGIRPSVALTLVAMDLGFQHAITARDVDHARQIVAGR